MEGPSSFVAGGVAPALEEREACRSPSSELSSGTSSAPIDAEMVLRGSNLAQAPQGAVELLARGGRTPGRPRGSKTKEGGVKVEHVKRYARAHNRSVLKHVARFHQCTTPYKCSVLLQVSKISKQRGRVELAPSELPEITVLGDEHTFLEILALMGFDAAKREGGDARARVRWIPPSPVAVDALVVQSAGGDLEPLAQCTGQLHGEGDPAAEFAGDQVLPRGGLSHGVLGGADDMCYRVADEHSEVPASE